MSPRNVKVSYNFPIKEKLERFDEFMNEEEYAQAKGDVYPIMHERVPDLLAEFLRIKLRFGSCVEQTTYANMKVDDLVTRLLTKRPLSFYGEMDHYL